MEIKKLVKQFDPFDESNKIDKDSDDLFSSLPEAFHPTNKPLSALVDRHPSIRQDIPPNHVTGILQSFQSTYGKSSQYVLRPNYSTPGQPQQNNLFNLPLLTRTSSIGTNPNNSLAISDDASSSFDPLAPINDRIPFPVNSSKPTETNGSNLIDFN
jgi:hypothetical protein